MTCTVIRSHKNYKSIFKLKQAANKQPRKESKKENEWFMINSKRLESKEERERRDSERER